VRATGGAGHKTPTKGLTSCTCRMTFREGKGEPCLPGPWWGGDAAQGGFSGRRSLFWQRNDGRPVACALKQRPDWLRFRRRYLYGLGNSNSKKVARAARTTQEASSPTSVLHSAMAEPGWRWGGFQGGSLVRVGVRCMCLQAQRGFT